jgi:hypothetical protein
MVQDVQADKANEEVAGYFIAFRYRHTIIIPRDDFLSICSRSSVHGQTVRDHAE